MPWPPAVWRSRAGLGRLLLLLTGFGMVAAGLTIQTIGVTRVFVPQDLAFMGLTADQLRAINPRLVPLIAHDRAGFGGGLVSCGIAFGLAVWFGRPSPALWQALAVKAPRVSSARNSALNSCRSRECSASSKPFRPNSPANLCRRGSMARIFTSPA